MSIEALAATKIRTNFKSCGPLETDSITGADNKTLRQRLEHDIALSLKNPKAISWGLYYYDELKMVYEKLVDIQQAIKDAAADLDLGQEPEDKLTQAIAAASRKKPDRTKIVNWFQRRSEDLNPKEVVGLFRFISTLRPACNKQLLVSKAAVSFCLKRQLHLKFKKLWDVLTKWVDGVYACMLRKSRTMKQTDAKFIEVNRKLMEMLFEGRVLEAAGGNGELEAGLLSVVAGAVRMFHTGKMLLAARVSKSICGKVKTHIRGAIDKLFYGKEDTMGQSDFDNAKAECAATLEQVEGIDTVENNREVLIPYRSIDVAVMVASLSDEVDMHFASMLKGILVEQGVLKPSFMDAILCSGSKVTLREKTRNAGKELLLEPEAAREKLAKMWGDAEVKSADDLQKVARKAANLINIDSTWKVEMSQISMLSRKDEHNRLCQSTLDAFPSQGSPGSTATQVATRLKAISGSILYKLSSAEAQSKAQMAANIVNQIALEQVPDVRTKDSDNWLKEVFGRCKWFCNYKSDTGVMCGQEAFVQKMTNAKEIIGAKLKKGDKRMRIDWLWELKTFKFLLEDAAQRKLCEELVKQVGEWHDQIEGVATKSTSAGSASAAAPTAGGAASSSSNSEKDKSIAFKRALSFFD